MGNRILVLILISFLLMNVCGCVAILAGTAGGVGTAAWLSGKLTQDVNAPFEHVIKAAKSALESLKLTVEKETVEKNSGQIISKYSDGKNIWIDIHRLTPTRSRIEIRVGVVSPDKEAADKILKAIIKYL
ncbi:MAG: DUF3568 family protein [Candidatus Omnitrophota bacterium]